LLEDKVKHLDEDKVLKTAARVNRTPALLLILTITILTERRGSIRIDAGRRRPTVSLGCTACSAC
jgi:hypothetical protein